MAGWKPGDPPKRGRRLRVVPDLPEETPSPPPAPRRRRRLSQSSASPSDEKAVAGGSGVQAGHRDRRAGREQKRVRLGNRWSEIVSAVQAGEYTWQQFVESLDDDEVARCQLRASDGTFTGRPPAIVPREFALAAGRELKKRFDDIFKQDVVRMAQQYVALANDPDVDIKTRAKMMQYGMERIFGGIPKEIMVTQEAPWESVVTSIVAEDGQEAPAVDRYAGREGEPEA